MNKELLSCPFCKQTNALDAFENEQENFIKCARCDLTMKCDSSWWSLEKLIDYWNSLNEI